MGTADADAVASSDLQVAPYLEAGCCGTIAGANAACRYIASRGPQSNMMGRSFKERAQVEQWIDWSGYELEPWRDVWVYPVLGVSNFNRDQGSYKAAKSDVQAKLKVLNNYLASRTFLVGERMTMADVSVCAALFDLFQNVLDVNYRKTIMNVERYFLTVSNNPAFLESFGKCTFTNKEQMPQGGQGGGKKKGGKKQNKAPKKAAAAPKPKEKKKTLKDLPKSKVILDDVKRNFSNKKFDVAVKEFYDDFDANGYCLYISNYNYNAENTVDFMTSNLCTGFLQRLDPARKWGMGVLNISGTGPYDVTGAWIFRGNEVPPPVTDSADAEYHTWTKVEPGNAKWEEYFNSETIDGKPLEERKWFK